MPAYPFPVVIQLHGCGGPKKLQAAWAPVAREAGWAVIVVDSAYDAVRDRFASHGGYILSGNELGMVRETVFPGGHLCPNVVGQSAVKIATMASRPQHSRPRMPVTSAIVPWLFCGEATAP